MDTVNKMNLLPNTISISALKTTLNKFFDSNKDATSPVFVLKNNDIVGAMVSTQFIKEYDQLVKEKEHEHEELIELQNQLRDLRFQQALANIPNKTLNTTEEIDQFFDEGGY